MKKYFSRISDFKTFESFESNSIQKSRSADSIQKSRDAALKVNRAIVWCLAQRGFFAEMIVSLNIYGSYSVETMQTNGLNIVYGIDFVLEQSDAAVRLVLLHEVLHCVGQHMARRGGRDPYLWNAACDFAINPILADDLRPKVLEWPKFPDGKPMGLCEERFAGMKAEDIYPILVKEKGNYDGGFGEVIDSDQKQVPPESEEDVVRKAFEDIQIKQEPKKKTEDPPPPKTEDPKDPPKDPKKGPSRKAIPGEIIVVKRGPNKGKIFIVLDSSTSSLQTRELTARQAAKKLLQN